MKNNKIDFLLRFIFLIVIVILCICLIFNRETITNNIPIRILVIKSGSMYPTLEIGDIVIIKKYKDYKVKDIVTYNYDGYLITHRIVEKENTNFITKGDNNNCKDEIEVNINNVKGKVIYIFNKQKRKNILILMLIIIAIIIFKKGIRNEKNY